MKSLPSGRSEGRATAELWARLDSGASAEEIAGAWLELQCRLVPRCRRALLLLGPAERGPFVSVAVWPEGQEAPPRLIEAAERALLARGGHIVGQAEPDEGGPAPLGGALVAQAICLGGELHGAVVIELGPRPDDELEALREQLRLGFGWLDSLLGRRQAAAEGGGKARLESVLGLLAVALEHERFQGAVTAFATELATELGCERVTVGFERHGKARIRGLSHSAEFGRRTNLIRAIEACMDEALDQQATLVYPPPQTDLPRAARAHAELSRQFGSAAICTVPLVRAGRTCGAVTLERAVPFETNDLRRIEVVAALAGPALEVQRRDDRFVAAKLLEALQGWLRDLFGAHHVALKLATFAALALALFLALANGDYRVTADSVLEPEVKRAAVAPFDGYVATAPVRAGDLVREGDLLGSLDARDLMLERVKWQSEYAQSLKQHRQALAERDAAEAEILAAGVKEARAELDRIDDRLARTDLKAPFDGIVVTGDLTRRLGAPVERGEVLFEVAPLDAYLIELQVDERDIAEIEPGQHGTLVLSSLPNESFEFVVDKITPVSKAEEGRNTFRVEATLQDTHERLRPGIEGVGKVEVGRRRLIWIWTHEAVDWLRLTLWSYTP